MPPPRIRCFTLVTELNDEWARLVGRHRDDLTWADRQPDLAGPRDLAEVIAAIRHRPDPVLAALLRESAAGDRLAARTVLQAMLGKVVRLAQTYPDLGVEEFVAAMWCRIRTYPLTRRPTMIAANLALDTRKDVLRAAQARRHELAGATVEAADWDRLLWRRSEPADDRPDRDAQLLIELAESMGLIDPATSSALQSVFVDGADSRTAAARLGTSAGMVRYRCSRGLRTLARHAERLIEAA